MLTTTEAAELLGIRSENAIEAMARRGQITATLIGTRYLIPMAAVSRLQDAPIMHELRIIERDYAAMAFLGGNESVGEEEMAGLQGGGTGSLPWRR